MRIVRTIVAMAVMATLYVAASATTATSANPVGNGFCDTPSPGVGDFCIGKFDSGTPWADWTGDNYIPNFNDWHYHGYPSDSPNDDGEFAINGDAEAQFVWQHSGKAGTVACFPAPYYSTDMKGVEDNDSSLEPRWGNSACP